MRMPDIFNRYIPFKYRIFTLPVITFLIVITLSLTLGKYMVDSIFSTRDELTSLNQKKAVLQAKDNLLSTVDSNQLRAESKAAMLAVPSETPSLPALATIRTVASQRGINLTNFTVAEGGDNKQAIRTLKIDVTVYGNLTGVVGFINDLNGYAPLMKVSDANINISTGNLANARLTFVSAWAPLPQSLGKTDSPLDPIKTNEQQIIDQLNSLKTVGTSSVSVGSASESGGVRSNPFEF
jgi:hypothetical protein